ncbi:hypothetical protein AA313_de0210299 [Arthrobotrys entomopaga]|nr:hypothetical protein AA313_de0210299 [Arthrobotrys entomopaga]
MVRATILGSGDEIPGKLQCDIMMLPDIKARPEFRKGTEWTDDILKPVLEESIPRLESALNNAEKLTMRHIQHLRDKEKRAKAQ